MRNPFALPVPAIATPPDTSAQLSSRYAATSGGALVPRSLGWAPGLRSSVATIPDADRLGTVMIRQYYPDGSIPPEEGFYSSRDRDKAIRERVTTTLATGWRERSGIGSEKRWADNPRTIPSPNSRVTQSLSPATYSFTRPFGQDVPHRLNGVHFSMADHKRTSDASIMGMAPQRRPGSGTRNTYRLTPDPWDNQTVTDETAVAGMAIVPVALPPEGRSWRLT